MFLLDRVTHSCQLTHNYDNVHHNQYAEFWKNIPLLLSVLEYVCNNPDSWITNTVKITNRTLTLCSLQNSTIKWVWGYDIGWPWCPYLQSTGETSNAEILSLSVPNEVGSTILLKDDCWLQISHQWRSHKISSCPDMRSYNISYYVAITVSQMLTN